MLNILYLVYFVFLTDVVEVSCFSVRRARAPPRARATPQHRTVEAQQAATVPSSFFGSCSRFGFGPPHVETAEMRHLVLHL